MRVAKRRGRPPLDRGRDVFHDNRGLAFEVFVTEARLGAKRGDLARATQATVEALHTKRLHVEYDTLKRVVSRYRHLRALAHGLARLPALGAELGRRTSGMPDDVREALLDLEGEALLDFLRAHDIDGTCPRWVIDAVRSGVDLLSLK